MIRLVSISLLVLTSLSFYAQDCEKSCANFENSQDEFLAGFNCPCYSDLFENYSEHYAEARDKGDFFGQGLALDKLSKITEFPLTETKREHFRIRYLFMYGVYNKSIDNLAYSKSIFDDILEKIRDPTRLKGKYFEIYNLTLHQLAEIATEQSQFNEAITHLQQAIDIEMRRVEGTEEEPLIFSMQSRIGYNYAQLKDHVSAYKYYQLGNKSIKDDLPKLKPDIVKLYINYFVGYLSWEIEEALELGFLAEAQYLLSTLKKIEVPGNPRNTDTYKLWAAYFHKMNQIDSAKHYFAKAEEGILALPRNYDRHLSYQIKYANFLSDQGQEENALAILTSAAVNTARLKSTSTKWSRDMVRLRTETISLLHDLGNTEKALSEIKELTEEVEGRLNGTVIFEDHISFIQEFYPIFEIGLRMISEQHPEKIELAYQIIECTKAISLYKSSQLSSQSRNKTEANLLTNYRMLASQANQVKLKQAEGDSSLETSTKIYALNARMATIKRSLNPTNKQSKIDLDTYTKSLFEKTHILSFAGSEHYYFLKMSQNDVTLRRVSAPFLEELLNLHIRKVSTFRSVNPKESARLLGIALASVLETPPGNTLLFTGDGLLAHVPIESLVMPDGRYQLEHAPTSYSPSAKIQYFLSSSRSKKLTRTAIFRPAFEHEELELTYAEQEATSVHKITGGDLYVDEYASKKAFLKDSEKYDILHLATHAKSVNDDPTKSYIQLSQSRLYFEEIKSMGLDAKMVCLGACQTNSGISYNGEGIQSLCRNFIASGAKSVVSSLWEIPDETTFEIMVAFYEYLKKGYSKAEALQLAKLAFIKDHPEEGNHPYNWAGLTVTGNETALYSSTANVIIAGTSGIILSGMIFILLLVGNLSKSQNSQVSLG